MFAKLLSPIRIAIGRTPVRWRWGDPTDDMDWVRNRIARRYHPHWYAGKYLWVSNLLYPMLLCIWPFRACLIIARRTLAYGAETKRRSGRGYFLQIVDQVMIVTRYRCNPEVYYLYALFEPGRLASADQYLMNNEIYSLVGILNGYVSDEYVEDKLSFNRTLRDAGVNVIEDLPSIYNGSACGSKSSEIEIPESDFIVKPRVAMRGEGFRCYMAEPDKSYRSSLGHTLSKEELRKEIAEQSQGDELLMQPRLRNHSDLADLSVNGFCTVRILTARTAEGDIRVVQGVFKMPSGDAFVDHYSKGAVAAPIDLASGRLGDAVSETILAEKVEVHPATGAQILGRQLPHWDQAKALLVRAHECFPQYVLLSWDLGISDDGPVIVEANRDLGMELYQKPGNCPLGDSDLPKISRRVIEAKY